MPAAWVDFICDETVSEVGSFDGEGDTVIEIETDNGTVKIAIKKN